MTILIGCSGWSYDDWVGRFYPVELAKKKGEWFSYYAKYFQTVEINSTFYRPPGELQVQSWIKKAQGREGFEYSLKVCRSSLPTRRWWRETVRRQSSGPGHSRRPAPGRWQRLAAWAECLLQLSPYFKNDGSALKDLLDLLDAVSRDQYDYAVEFRHSSWLGRHRSKGRGEGDAAGDRIGGASKSENASNITGRKEIDPVVLEALRERNVANVLIDGPEQHESMQQTADHAYVRFHGRNYDIWYKGEKKADHRLDRYDYHYTKEQLDLGGAHQRSGTESRQGESLLQQPRPGKIGAQCLSAHGHAFHRASG